MSARQMRKILKDLISVEQQKLREIETRIKIEEPALTNRVYLKLLANASYHSSRVYELNDKLKLYRKRNFVKNVIVDINSKVKLVSTKIGATIWVDAQNYVELLGKNLGDVINMHNSTYLIAGIY